MNAGDSFALGNPLQYGVLTVGGIFMPTASDSAIVSRVWGWVWIGWWGFWRWRQSRRGRVPEEKTAKYMESVRPSGRNCAAFSTGECQGRRPARPLVWRYLCREHDRLGVGERFVRGSQHFEADPRGLRFLRTVSEQAVGALRVSGSYSLRPIGGCVVDEEWHAAEESGHDHFFATFDKFGPAFEKHVGDALAEVASRAAADHLQYVELMHTADGAGAAMLGAKVGWDDDFGKLRDKLLAGGMADVVASVRSTLDSDEARKKEVLHAGRRRRLRDARLRFIICIRCCADCPRSRCLRRSCSDLS